MAQETGTPGTSSTLQVAMAPDSNHALIDKELQASLAALAHKHVTVSYVLIGVIVFVLLLGCGGAYIASKIYDKEIARAEAAEKQSNILQQQAAAAQQLMVQYKTESDAKTEQYTQQLEADKADRVRDAQTIASLQQQIQNRDAAAHQQETNVLAPGKSAQDAYNDLAGQFKLTTPFTPEKDKAGNDRISFLTPDVQQFTAAKIEANTSKADLAATNSELDAAKHTNVTLTNDLGNAQAALGALTRTESQCEDTVKQKNATIDEKNKTIADYKKAAGAGKWRKMLNGAEKVLLFVGGIYIGHKI
jgi:predicted RND superfamily exporter protein